MGAYDVVCSSLWLNELKLPVPENVSNYNFLPFLCHFQNDPLRNADRGVDAIQIKPQELHVHIRPSTIN
jgi:hypothetical protein